MNNQQTNTRFIVDSWAWIEYFDGSLLGNKVKDYVENEKNVIFTSVLTIAEVMSKFLRKQLDPSEVLNGINNLSRVLNVDTETAVLAGKLHAETKVRIKDFGLSDAFILAASRIENTKIITGDLHFKSFPEVIFISKQLK